MLIKYKTEPTIIVLSSPNSANLIKILTQFVYSLTFDTSPTSFTRARNITGCHI